MRRKVSNFVMEVLVFLASLFVLAPISIMVFGSFKDRRGAAQLSISLPDKWHFENYMTVFEVGGIGRALVNSVFLTFVSVIAVIVFSAMAAFYLIRHHSKLNKFILNLFYFGLVAPMALIPTIKVFQWFSVSGTYLSAILIFTALHLSFSVFLFSGFIKTVPRELDEAGVLDGCGSYRLFFFIVFPILLPVIATNSIIQFMGVWNDLTIPLFFLNSSDKWTMPLTVYNFFGQYQQSWNLVFADLILTTAPVFLFFIFCQRYIIEGMTGGAVKS